ncbi:MAG: YgiQ family radical SAM protein [Methanobacteriota archaeon]
MAISREGSGFDVVLVSAEYWDDHPLCPVGVIARVLDSEGFSVGVVEKPVGDEDFAKLGAPKLFFGVTSGSIDSMLNNYTPLKRSRKDDPHADWNPMPDRAVVAYCNALRRLFKGCKIAIGGIEASLRRFAHYDYWDNAVRRSVLLDSRADILAYGNGETQAAEIAARLRDGKDLSGIPGTCVLSRELPDGFAVLPSYAEARDDKRRFCEMQMLFSNDKALAQAYDRNYVLQHPAPGCTPKELDAIYALPFSRKMHPKSQLKMAQFSVVTHRGCIGECSFCSLALHQGRRIVSRSEDSIVREIGEMARHPEFKGYVDDLGGPSANMYGMDCANECGDACLACPALDRSHSRLVGLMRRARAVPGVKKVFVRSGVRYDLAMESREYVRELSGHHVSGTLKIAPEHVSKRVLALMNKDGSRFSEFCDLFNSLNRDTGQTLRHYFMVGHPGDDMQEVRLLAEKAAHLGNAEQFQLFTPTPMTLSTCIYWAGLDPRTMKPVKVVYDYATKKRMKTAMTRTFDSLKPSF